MSTLTPSNPPLTAKAKRAELRTEAAIALSTAPLPPIAGSNNPGDAPSFKAFSALIDRGQEAAKLARLHHSVVVAQTANPSSGDLPGVESGLRDFKVGEESSEEETDGRTLLERLIDPTPASNASTAALIARSLQIQHGELIIQIGQHNLHERSLACLLDGPVIPSKTTPSTTTTISKEIPTSIPPPTDGVTTSPSTATPSAPLLLTTALIAQILSTLQTITSEIASQCNILHNPFSPTGECLTTSTKPPAAPIPPQAAGEGSWNIMGLESESSQNEGKVEERWTGKALRLLIRRVPEGAFELNECRVAVVGNVDAGKSSLLGVLTKGRLDDGRGRARVNLFRHKHEIESGRTSSVGMELLGFLPNGKEVIPEGPHGVGESLASQPRKQQLSWESISASAAKIISFADLAGHEKYLKTTLFGLTATSPDFVLLIVGANAGLIGMSKEHLSVALALSVPVVCVVTKIDMTPPNVTEQTLKQLVKVLRSPGCRKQPVFVKNLGMACELAAGFVEEKACPIFLVSNVTGEGLPLLRTFLNVVPTSSVNRYPIDADLEFSISDVFSVPFVGTVVSGVILSGAVAVGDTVSLGPDSLGAFATTVVKSIQRKRVNVLHAEAGQSVSFGLKKIKRAGVRKGMVLLQKTEEPPKAVERFEGTVLILYHNTLIAPRYQAMLHVGSVRQTVQIEAINDKACIRTGDRASCTFKFLKFPEFVKVGDRFLFREGRTKALGIITKLL